MSTKNVIIDPGNGIDQSERDRLPDHSGAAGSSYVPRHKRAGLPWQAWVCFCVGFFGIGGYLIVRFVQWLSSVSAATSARSSSAAGPRPAGRSTASAPAGGSLR